MQKAVSGVNTVTLTTGSGITDCTVGDTTSAAPANYSSVAAALAAGCSQIRIIGDAAATPPGGIFTEPTGFTVDATTGPVMIYITPGVNWVLRASLVGVGGIDFTSQTLVFRGSGNDSRMTLINDSGGAGSMLAAGGVPPSSLYLLDLHLLSDGNVAIGSLLDSGQIVADAVLANCTVTATDTSGGVGPVGSGPIISGSQGGFLANWKINNCSFVADAAVDTTAVVMIDAFATFGTFVLSDCTFLGDMAPGTGGAIPFALRIAGTNEAVVNNLLFGGNAVADPIGIALFNGEFSNITSRTASGGALNVYTGTGGKLSNLTTDGIISFVTTGAFLSNCRIRNTAGGLLSVTSDHEIVNSEITGVTTISGTNNKFTNCVFVGTGGVDFTMAATASRNDLVNCTIPTIASLSGPASPGPGNSYTNCLFSGGVVGSIGGFGHKFSQCEFTASPITTIASSSHFDNCRFLGGGLTLGDGGVNAFNTLVTNFFISSAASLSIAGGTEECVITGGHTTGSATLDGTEHIMSNVNTGGAISTPGTEIMVTGCYSAAALTNGGSRNTVSGCHLAGIGSWTGGSDNTLTGCLIESAAASFSTASDPNISNNIFLVGPTVFTGATGGTVSNNTFTGGVTIDVGVNATTFPLFTGNKGFAGGQISPSPFGLVAGSHPNSTGNGI